MKDDKKRILTVILLALIIILGAVKVYLEKDKVNDSDNNTIKDAVKFKKEYESLNGKALNGDYKYPTVTLTDTNPFVYESSKKIIETLKSGTGIIYLGFPKCPWCRNAVNVLSYLNVDKIMYLDMTDERDSYELVDGALKKTKDGSKEYYEMLNILDDILSDYEIEDNGKTYSVGEKRIYVPLVIGVKDGKIVGYHVDTVELNEGQTAFDLLSNDQQEKLKNIYDDIKDKVYGDTCGLSDKGC